MTRFDVAPVDTVAPDLPPPPVPGYLHEHAPVTVVPAGPDGPSPGGRSPGGVAPVAAVAAVLARWGG
ncbi:MAG TPA: hypothetical protein VGD67_00765, partial [Pseudonocardiaceae bacterium]